MVTESITDAIDADKKLFIQHGTTFSNIVIDDGNTQAIFFIKKENLNILANLLRVNDDGCHKL